MKNINILHLYYDLLNLYGESGNIIALRDTLRDQGLEVNIDKKTLGDTIDFMKYDIVYIGQGMAQERAEALKKRVEDELNMKATILWIGPIVGTTCGPGVIATFCHGKEVTRYEGDNVK